MFSRRGHLTLAHNDNSLRTMRWRAEVNKLQGVDSEVIGPAEIKQLAPCLDTSPAARYPMLGALYHPPGGIIRHDAVVWGYARGADARGVGNPPGHRGDWHRRGARQGAPACAPAAAPVASPVVLNCTAGWSTLICGHGRGARCRSRRSRCRRR